MATHERAMTIRRDALRPALIGRLLLAAGVAACGLVLARVSPDLALGAMLVAVGLLVLLLQPHWGLYALAFAIPFGSMFERSLGPMTVGPSEVLLSGVVVSCALRLLARRDVSSLRQSTWLWLGISAYLASLTLSLLPARELTLGLVEVVKWIEVLLLYFLVSSQLSERQRRGLLICLLLAGAAQAALGVYQFVGQVGPPGFVLFDRYMRAYGSFEQPNPFGGYLGLVLPLCYGLLLGGLGRTLPKGRRWLFTCGVACVGALLLAGLLMSWSRGALLGLVGGLALVALVWSRRFWPLLLIAGVAAGLFAPQLAALTHLDWFSRLTDLTTLIGHDLTAVEITDVNFANVERLAHWVAGWRMFGQRPWLGVGTGQYPVVYERVAIPRWNEALGHAHNYYVHTLAEGGLVALASYLLMMVGATVAVARRALKGSGWSRGVALGALGMVGHLWAHSLVDSLYVHEMYLLVAMVLGLALATSRRDPQRIEAE